MMDSLVDVDLSDDDDFQDVMEGAASDTVDEFIARLLKQGHFGPMEHPQASLAIERVSRTCMAQFRTHRHATFDVQSLRYTIPDFDVIYDIWDSGEYERIEDYVIVPRAIEVHGGEEMRMNYLKECAEDFVNYAYYVRDLQPEFEEIGYKPSKAKKMAAQDARFKLPQGTAVNMTVSANLRAWMHIIDMRDAGDAQWEARDLAQAIHSALHDVAPITFENYDQHAKGASKKAP